MHARRTSTVLPFFLRLLTDRTSQCRIEILCNLSASEPVDHRASPSLVLATTAFSSRSMMPVAGSLESFFCFLLQIALCRLIFRSPFFSLKFAVPAASACFPLVLASGLFRCLSLLRCSWIFSLASCLFDFHFLRSAFLPLKVCFQSCRFHLLERRTDICVYGCWNFNALAETVRLVDSGFASCHSRGEEMK